MVIQNRRTISDNDKVGWVLSDFHLARIPMGQYIGKMHPSLPVDSDHPIYNLS